MILDLVTSREIGNRHIERTVNSLPFRSEADGRSAGQHGKQSRHARPGRAINEYVELGPANGPERAPGILEAAAMADHSHRQQIDRGNVRRTMKDVKLGR